jgi:hypothetical protein
MLNVVFPCLRVLLDEESSQRVEIAGCSSGFIVRNADMLDWDQLTVEWRDARLSAGDSAGHSPVQWERRFQFQGVYRPLRT